MPVPRTTVVPAIRSAIRGLVRSPLRSFILLQGVMWATTLGVLPPAVIDGSQEAAIEQAKSLGSDRVVVYEAPGEERNFDWEIVAGVRGLGWEEIQSAVGYGKAEGLLAVDHEHGGKRSRRLIEGRWFSREDIESGAPVALISASEATRRFGDSSAIGKEVSSPANGALRLRVIGTFVIEDERAKLFDDFGYKKDHAFSGFLREVLEYSGVRERNLDWMLEPVRVLVPARSHRDLPVEVAELSVSPELLSPTVERLKKELVRKGMRPVVVSNLMVQVVFSETLDSLGGLHSALFLVAILAGVVVVANMHLLTMLERTREIAIRRVEGATRRLIAIQFIVETGTSCFIGSVLGVPLALGLAWFRTALEPSGSLHWSVPTLEIFQTVAAVTIAGIVGGLLPAYRAAKVEPIEVLSHD